MSQDQVPTPENMKRFRDIIVMNKFMSLNSLLSHTRKLLMGKGLSHVEIDCKIELLINMLQNTS